MSEYPNAVPGRQDIAAALRASAAELNRAGRTVFQTATDANREQAHVVMMALDGLRYAHLAAADSLDPPQEDGA